MDAVISADGDPTDELAGDEEADGATIASLLRIPSEQQLATDEAPAPPGRLVFRMPCGDELEVTQAEWDRIQAILSYREPA